MGDDDRFQTTIQALLAAGLRLQRTTNGGTSLTIDLGPGVSHNHEVQHIFSNDDERVHFASSAVEEEVQRSAQANTTSAATHAADRQQHRNFAAAFERNVPEKPPTVDVSHLASNSTNQPPDYRMHIVPHNFYGPCRVCNADATGLHYGVATCEGCKGFFKRSLETDRVHPCASGNDDCEITSRTRNACRACRLKKCREVGMEWKLHRKRFRMRNLIHQRAELSSSSNSPLSQPSNPAQRLLQNRSISSANNNMFAVPVTTNGSNLTPSAQHRTLSTSGQSILAASISLPRSHERTVYAAYDQNKSKRLTAGYRTIYAEQMPPQPQQQEESSDDEVAIISAALKDDSRGHNNNSNSNLGAVLSQDTLNKLLKIISNSARVQLQQSTATNSATAAQQSHMQSTPEVKTNMPLPNDATLEQQERQQLLQLVGRLTSSLSSREMPNEQAVPVATERFVLQSPTTSLAMHARDEAAELSISMQQQHQQDLKSPAAVCRPFSAGDVLNLSTKLEPVSISNSSSSNNNGIMSRPYNSLPNSINQSTSSSPALNVQYSRSVHTLPLSPAILKSNRSPQHLPPPSPSQQLGEKRLRHYRYKNVAALISQVQKNFGEDIVDIALVEKRPVVAPVAVAASLPDSSTFDTVQMEAVTRELNATVTRLLTKRKSLQLINIVDPSNNGDGDAVFSGSAPPAPTTSPFQPQKTPSPPRKVLQEKKLPTFDEVLSAVRRKTENATVGSVCDFCCDYIWPTWTSAASQSTLTDAATLPSRKSTTFLHGESSDSKYVMPTTKRAKISHEKRRSPSSWKHRIIEATENQMPRSSSASQSLDRSDGSFRSSSPPPIFSDCDVLEHLPGVEELMDAAPVAIRRNSTSNFSFDTHALTCASSSLSVPLRMRELAEYTSRQNSLSLALHVRNFLRPNIGILNACARLLDDGFSECWLQTIERARTKSSQLKTIVVYQPETTIDRFYETVNTFIVALVQILCKFGEYYVPGFWTLSPAVRAFCVTTNYSATYLAVFGGVNVEIRGTSINLSDHFANTPPQKKEQKPAAESKSSCSSTETCAGSPFAAENSSATGAVSVTAESEEDPHEEVICSDYWMRYHLPEAVLNFYKRTADFVRELELPNILKAAFAATVFLRPLRLDRIPECIREEVQTRAWRPSASRAQWRKNEIELAEAHEYAYRLLHQLIAQQYGTRSGNEKAARIVYNKIVFFLAVLSERMAVFDCKIFEQTPLHFYDDGALDWERLRHHVGSCCPLEVARWLNAVWPVARSIDFARENFNINEILLQVDDAVRMQSGDEVVIDGVDDGGERLSSVDE